MIPLMSMPPDEREHNAPSGKSGYFLQRYEKNRKKQRHRFTSFLFLYNFLLARLLFAVMLV